MLGKRKMLGLAATSRSVTAVEVVAANGGGRATCAAEFVFTDHAGLREPVALGKALRRFLRGQGFSASRCVIGMEANWLTAREKALPPGAGGPVRDILSLMAEREFASDRTELVFDYALGAETSGQRAALLVAAPRQVLDGLSAMAQAAGLTVAAITASTMALAAWGNGAAGDRLVLHLFAGGAELALHSAGAMRMMRRLPVSIPASPGAGEGSANGWVADLASQLRRVVSLLPSQGAEPAARELLVWDEAGLDEASQTVLAEQLALPVRLCERLPGLEGALEPARRLPGAQVSAAAAMALEALQGRPPAVDLLHSRLSPQRRLGLRRKLTWAGAVVVALLTAGTVLALDWRSDSLEAASLATKLAEMSDDLADARDVIAKVTFARPWYDRRPSYLDCMRELTLAFPEEGLIWTTSLAVQEDMRVVFSGKAVSESAVLDVLDRLQANPKLSDIKPLYLREAGREGREVAFAMSFTFTQPDETWPSPSGKRPSSPRR